MGKASTKENTNMYHISREELGLTREKASELLECISADKLEKIENQGVIPHPEDVLVMAEKYKKPTLCNYYCSKECAIGQKYVPHIEIKDLSQIVLEMLSSLNGIERNKDRLIDITADGMINDDEIADLIKIQNQLERISITVETLQLWVEKMRANGFIDEDRYNEIKNRN